jgi:hypothetical protein
MTRFVGEALLRRMTNTASNARAGAGTDLAGACPRGAHLNEASALGQQVSVVSGGFNPRPGS